MDFKKTLPRVAGTVALTLAGSVVGLWYHIQSFPDFLFNVVTFALMWTILDVVIAKERFIPSVVENLQAMTLILTISLFYPGAMIYG